MNKEFSEDLNFFESRLKAQCLRNEFFKTGDELTKISYRKVFSTVTDSIDEDLLPGLMSEYSRELLKQIDFTLINETRKKNQKKPAIRGINPGGADDNLSRFGGICRKLAEG